MDPRETADEHVRRRMPRQRRRDTRPELAIRSELHQRGLRYRIDVQIVPGHPRRRVDITFGPSRVAMFIDGCFWHSCPDHGNVPVHNRDWWNTKLNRNVARDRESDRLLHEVG
jgi:DNA mismatch endonuclease (patch repair protein)